jgi:hypothetical protein
MNKLETKVAARNLVHSLAKAMTPFVRNSLEILAGDIILLQSGGQSAKFRKAVAALDLPSRVENTREGVTFRLSCYVGTGHGYSVTANYRVEITNDSGTTYGEATVYLFDITNGIMRTNPNYAKHVGDLRSDYTAQGVLADRLRVKTARAEMQAAESALANFGEHDHN